MFYVIQVPLKIDLAVTFNEKLALLKKILCDALCNVCCIKIDLLWVVSSDFRAWDAISFVNEKRKAGEIPCVTVCVRHH